MEWLSVSKRIASIECAHNEQALRKQLAITQRQLVIYIAEHRNQILPAYLLRYPDTRVLVLTPKRKLGGFIQWLQQGATDIVSLQKPVMVQHALSRLIDECVQNIKLNQLIERNRELEAILAAQSTFTIDLQAGDKSNAKKVNTKSQINLPVLDTDSATGLPARSTVLKNFEQLLKNGEKQARYTAMLVRVFTAENSKSVETRSDKSRQDLSLYRAANLLQYKVKGGSLIGRIDDNALLLIQAADAATGSREVANKVRQSLGSLGGLIESARDVRINTLNLSSSVMSANEVVERLEAR